MIQPGISSGAPRAGWASITLNRPERKNPLTFESYAELRDLFWDLKKRSDVKAIVITGAGGNFCSGGDVHEIIGPLTRMTLPRAAGIHAHDRRPGEGDAPLPAAGDRRGRGRVRRARARSSPWRATCATRRRARRCAFLFVRVGLAGCDMGACAILPRIIGQGRAAELLYTGRSMSADEGLAWGFFNQVY